MSQFCQVFCVAKQDPGAAEYEVVLVSATESDGSGVDEEAGTSFDPGPGYFNHHMMSRVAESQHVVSATPPSTPVPRRELPVVSEEWNTTSASSGNTNGNLKCLPPTGHKLPQNGTWSSATLPRSANRRQHPAHVSFDQGARNASNKSILKPSPVKLLPPGRIEVIREEVEIEVATNSRLTAACTMHRSVESSHPPPPIPPVNHTQPSHRSPHDNAQHVPVSMQSDRTDFPIYSEPVIVPGIPYGNKLRSDYHDSHGSHLPAACSNDDDPGVMSEADTTSTGFRRGGKVRSSLPLVRTVSKTLERPLGLVFLQFREETKRAILPNEITTLDTVKALFVRAFPRTLTMQCLDSSQMRKIYILDQRKDMFYELEDLSDIRDRSVLKILEADQLTASSSSDNYSSHPVDEINYFSEPEFDTLSESHRYPGYHHSKAAPRHPVSSSLNRGNMSYPSSAANMLSAFSVPPPHVPPKPQRSSNYGGNYTPFYEEPIYANANPEKRPPSRSGAVTPIIDEEARYRVDAMERHLANLTGLVQQAISGGNSNASTMRKDSLKNSDYANVYISPNRTVAQKDHKLTNNAVPSVNGLVKRSQHNAETAVNKSHPDENGLIFLRYPDPMLMEYLENVQRKIKEMRGDARTLRRLHQSQALTMREIIKENFERLKSHFGIMALPALDQQHRPSPRTRTDNEIHIFQQDAARLTRDMQILETSIEELKTGAVNQKSQLSLRDVERCTNQLNELSNYLSDLRLKFPELQEKVKAVMTSDMEIVIKDEMFIKGQPEKLEDMAKRCKRLTGTLLNLNKLASVQDYLPREQEVLVDLPPHLTQSSETQPTEALPQPPVRKESLNSSDFASTSRRKVDKKAQDALDDLLSELEVFTDVSSRETTPDKDSSTIKRSPKSSAKPRNSEIGYVDLNTSLSPPSITPSNSSQSTGTTMSSMTDNSSNFSGSDCGTTISKVQVGVGDLKTTISPVPLSSRNSATSSGVSTPARKASDAERNLTAWLSSVNIPAPPPRNTSKSPLISPLSKTGGFFTLPNYGRTISEPGDYQGGSYAEYTNAREVRSPSIKDQRLTPQQQNTIASYYTSKLRKASLTSDPGGIIRSLIDDPSRDLLGQESRSFRSPRGDAGYLSDSYASNREPPVLPPKPGREEDDGLTAPPLPPRNRQEVLEERHQELLRKQRQLQEQYARLQQLQRDQKVRPNSPVNKPSTTPQSGSLTDLKRQHLSKISGSEIYATPNSKPLYHQMNITNGTMDAKKIYETDIL